MRAETLAKTLLSGARRKQGKLFHAGFALELRADRLQHIASWAGQGTQDALQLVDVQCQRAEALHLPQQRAHVGALWVPLLNGDQLIAGKRRLQSHARITVHPYRVENMLGCA